MGIGYTRQSAASIIDGNTIDAEHFNNEFNAIENAFNATTGHSHDGTLGEGPLISLTASVTGILPLANGGTGSNLTDPNADRILFWDDSAGTVTWLTAGSSLNITTTTINLADGDKGDITVSSSGTVWELDAGVITNTEVAVGANIDATKIGTGVVDNTEFNYLNGVTSGIQSQIDLKAPLASPTFTGTVTVPATNFTVGASLPFSDTAGTLTLQNIDALDATTEATIEAAIDTLASLSSIQGVSFTMGAYASTLLNNANEAAFKAAVNLEAGVDYQAYDADLASWAGVTRASGFDTFVATPSSANLRALLTDEVGTGAAYFIGGDLGTPSAVVLTNGTGLPVSGITSSTSTALGVGSLELGHASDTTLSRSAAGIMAVEGNVVPSVADPGYDAVPMWDDSASAYVATPHFGKNHIINGSFSVAQRGTSFTSATTPANSDDTYLLDRWILLSDGNDIVDVTQSTNAPTNGLYAIGLDVETVNKKFGILQIIEQKNCIGLIGNTVTLSFQARVTSTTKLDNVKCAILAWSSTADTVTSDIVSAWGVEGTNPTLAANWTYENTPANLGVTTSWATYTVSAAIDTASTTNIAVFIWSDVTDTTLGDFLYITDVQLERGSVPTLFERRPHQVEFDLCTRYYQYYDNLGFLSYGQNVSGMRGTWVIPEMRTSPTPSFSGISYTNASTLTTSSTTSNVLGVTVVASSTAVAGVQFDCTLATEL